MLDAADRLAVRRWTLRCWLALASFSVPAVALAGWTASPVLGALGKALFLFYGIPTLVALGVWATRQLLRLVNREPASR